MENENQLIPASALTSRVWTNEETFPPDLEGQWKVSASQVKTWKACPRKWGFKYLDGIPDPAGPAAAFGSAVHKVLENWLKDPERTIPDTTTSAGKVAAAGLAHYPLRGDVDVEPQIFFVAHGILYRGFVDAVWSPETDDDNPDVYDHKTSSDPKKWGLSEKALPHDPQALIYGVWALDFWDTPRVNLNWVYYKTRGKAIASRVSTSLSREDARTNFDSIVAPVGAAIAKARGAFEDGTITTGNQLEASPAACGDFGGCPFAPFCDRTEDEILTATFGPKTKDKDKDKNMGLKELLANKRRKAAPPRPGTPEFETATNVVQINPPEAPATPEVAREISRAVGATTGNAAGKKEKARTIANATAGATTPEAARTAALGALGKVETKPAPSPAVATGKAPSETEILAFVAMGVHQFVKSRDKATKDHPFAHGRTLKAMKRKGLINFREDFPSAGFRTVMITDAGKEESGIVTPHAPPVEGMEFAKATHGAPADRPIAVEEPKRKGNNLPAISGTIELRPAPAHREVLCTFLVASGGNVEKADALFAAYCKHFPMGT